MYNNPYNPSCYPVYQKPEALYPEYKQPCAQQPGTVLRISIPAGAAVNLLNLVELSSPSGICLIARIPLLGGTSGLPVTSLMESIQKAGGNIEVLG